MNRRAFLGSLVGSLASSAGAGLGVALARPPAVVERTVVVLSSSGMDVRFDQRELTVPTGRPVRLRYRNDAPAGSDINHNVVVVRPGRFDALIEGLQENDYSLKWVAGSPDVLGMTKVLRPGETDAIEFTPTAAADYPYVCVMPGHGDIMGMRGTLHVK